MPTVALHTLGCKLNFAESGTLAGQFHDQGYDTARPRTPADVTVINTCTVTKEADRKCRQLIRRLLRTDPNTFLIVTGCYAQLKPDDLAAIPGVDAVLGAEEKFHIFDIVQEFRKRERTQIEVSCISEQVGFGPAVSRERTRAFLKIQDGCDYSCSFCTIPKARGPSRSQSISSTLAQIDALAKQGYREVILSGVNVGLYGADSGESLFHLVREIERHASIDRVRISSIEPNLLTDDLIDIVAASPRMMPHFHMPLQSGDDYVLGQMRRRYQRNVYAARVGRILDRMPDACIGADVIVGFPAEDRARFQNTHAFLSDLPLSYLHVFTYSERPGTAAVDGSMEKSSRPVEPTERGRRNRLLRLLSERKRMAFYHRHIGSARPVLWEDEARAGRMFGFTDNYIRVFDRSDADRRGTVDLVELGPLVQDGAVKAKVAPA